MENRLRQLREERNFTQQKLAELCNTTQANIAALEKKKSLQSHWIFMLAKALGCHPFEILSSTAPDTTPDEERILKKMRALTPEQMALTEAYIDFVIKEKVGEGFTFEIRDEEILPDKNEKSAA